MRIPLTLTRRRDTSPVVPGAAGTPVPARPDARQRAHGVRVPTATRLTWAAASRLLDYPDEALLADLPRLRELIERAGHGARGLSFVVEHLERASASAAQAEYVETFDLRRRCALHLTYYSFGDTRRRGLALLDLKQTYQACGVDVTDDELPDHLCVLLDFAATVDPAVGQVLLQDHRAGLELVRLSLTDRGSVYRHALETVSGTLPTLLGTDKDAVRRLIESGPPDEEVGMEAYTSGSAAACGTRS